MEIGLADCQAIYQEAYNNFIAKPLNRENAKQGELLALFLRCREIVDYVENIL